MTARIGEVFEAFEYLYAKLLDRSFAKSAGFEHYSESELLPLVRAYLLGYFEDIEPELTSSLPGCSTKYGRIDFRVGDVAVELAVRSSGVRRKRALCADENQTEVRKLLRWPGQGLLVLYDFGSPPLSDDDLERYRTLPKLGRGQWATSSFQLAYFYRAGRPRAPTVIAKRIRAS